jgi:hypothetical protein
VSSSDRSERKDGQYFSPNFECLARVLRCFLQEKMFECNCTWFVEKFASCSGRFPQNRPLKNTDQLKMKQNTFFSKFT